MHISELPPELLIRIFHLGSIPDSSSIDTEPISEPHYTNPDSVEGLNLYGIAGPASQVCHRWQLIIWQEPSLYYLRVNLGNCNPRRDYKHRAPRFYGDEEGDLLPDQSLESDDPISEVTFDERFNLKLQAASHHPNCDIHLYTPNVLEWSQQGLTHFKALPEILIRCASRLRIFRCCLLDWITDGDQKYENILLALFGGTVTYPRLEYLYLTWDDDKISLSERSERLLQHLCQSDTVPNLLALFTYPCPWHWMKKPVFPKMQYLQLNDLGESVELVDPELWQMVNAQPRLKTLSLLWPRAMENGIMITVFPASQCIIVYHITTLELFLPDEVGWGLLLNIWLPNLANLVLRFSKPFDAYFSFDTYFDYDIYSDLNRPSLSFLSLTSLTLYPLHESSVQFLSVAKFPVLEHFSSHDSNDGKSYREPFAPWPEFERVKRFRMPALLSLSLQADLLFTEWFLDRLNSPRLQRHNYMNDEPQGITRFVLRYIPSQAPVYSYEVPYWSRRKMSFHTINPNIFFHLKSLHISYDVILLDNKTNRVEDPFMPIVSLDVKHAPSLDTIEFSAGESLSEFNAAIWARWFTLEHCWCLFDYLSDRVKEGAPIRLLIFRRLKDIPEETLETLCDDVDKVVVE